MVNQVHRAVLDHRDSQARQDLLASRELAALLVTPDFLVLKAELDQ